MSRYTTAVCSHCCELQWYDEHADKVMGRVTDPAIMHRSMMEIFDMTADAADDMFAMIKKGEKLLKNANELYNNAKKKKKTDPDIVKNIAATMTKSYGSDLEKLIEWGEKNEDPMGRGMVKIPDVYKALKKLDDDFGDEIQDKDLRKKQEKYLKKLKELSE